MTYDPRPAEGTPLDSAINEMDEISEHYPEGKRLITFIKNSLERIKDCHADGVWTNERASAQLFHLYCNTQDMTQAFPPLPGILRVVGEDFGTTLGVNSDLLWQQYEQALDDAQQQSTTIASTLELFL